MMVGWMKGGGGWVDGRMGGRGDGGYVFARVRFGAEEGGWIEGME